MIMIFIPDSLPVSASFIPTSVMPTSSCHTRFPYRFYTLHCFESTAIHTHARCTTTCGGIPFLESLLYLRVGLIANEGPTLFKITVTIIHIHRGKGRYAL